MSRKCYKSLYVKSKNTELIIWAEIQIALTHLKMCYILWYKYEMVTLSCESIIYIYNAEPLRIMSGDTSNTQ